MWVVQVQFYRSIEMPNRNLCLTRVAVGLAECEVNLSETGIKADCRLKLRYRIIKLSTEGPSATQGHTAKSVLLIEGDGVSRASRGSVERRVAGPGGPVPVELNIHVRQTGVGR
jgi:hypothetical protein